MNAKKLLKEIKLKLKMRTDRQLTSAIGITQPTLIHWRNERVNLTIKQVSAIIVKAIKRGECNARKYSIKPIIEYYPIKVTESKHGEKKEIINISGIREKKIKETLSKEHGIYVFYNSQCNAIYIGKAKKLNLWGEMKNAFNRARDPQVLWHVKHPSTGTVFSPAYEKERQIEKRKVYLHDIALYFSAYSIEKDFIDNAEALLIRIFANDLTNEKMEKFESK